ncbi:hypothetical protein PVAND_014622 [Polypedilum vanderplanki]|uniref:Uncharacterized protein n=1 Tax=Polypedilum vanderplanki TaxID=319348 RepID=A0A9J6BA90_POLVA|nr:hypothetical protein PVAND_014622 [Polypedilum vanderplanki]
MRILVQLILISFFFSATLGKERTLNSLYDFLLTIFKIKGDDPKIKPFKNANRECLKEKLRVNEFGDKIVDEDFGISAGIAASFLCSDDRNAAYGASLDQVLSEVPIINNVECYKRRLLELQPTSIIVKNFVADSNVNCRNPLFSASELENINAKRMRVFRGSKVIKCINSDIKETEWTEVKESILKVMQGEPGGISEEIKQETFNEMRKEHEDIFKCTFGEMTARFN